MSRVRPWGSALGAAMTCALGACDLFLAQDAAPGATPVDARSTPVPDAGPTEQQAVLAHNQIRAQAQPRPTPALEPMRWDESAAAVARDWARGCRFAHSGAGGYGENLYASSSTTATIAVAVAAWASEAADYAYAGNGCAAGKVCGHYTQLVWRESTGVGCATQVCDTGSPFGSGRWMIWVCDYLPPGNTTGERPY